MDSGITLPGLLTQLVSFLVLFGALYLVLYKPMTRMLDSRSLRIRESLESADRARQEPLPRPSRLNRNWPRPEFKARRSSLRPEPQRASSGSRKMFAPEARWRRCSYGLEPKSNGRGTPPSSR